MPRRKNAKKPVKTYFYNLLLIIISLFYLSGCVTAPPPPHARLNVCKIFNEYPDWYWDAKSASNRWHIPIGVLMSIMYHESGFHASARPAMETFLFIIPVGRASSAYGYSQALNQTWRNYKNETGRFSARRTSFSDSIDFIGWYSNKAHRRAHISLNNAYEIYLSYHEGIGGYLHGTYYRKHWLVAIAHGLQHRAIIYESQLVRCETYLRKQKPESSGFFG